MTAASATVPTSPVRRRKAAHRADERNWQPGGQARRQLRLDEPDENDDDEMNGCCGAIRKVRRRRRYAIFGR
jgi:hypothetical protein